MLATEWVTPEILPSARVETCAREAGSEWVGEHEGRDEGVDQSVGALGKGFIRRTSLYM